jgi:hypothetical protein
MGFVGRVEYLHGYGGSGGAAYFIGATPDDDRLLVDAEGFDRDANPEDFSLEAVIAHERGHRIVHRGLRRSRIIAVPMTPPTEEILASLLGALLVESERDRDDLIAKALAEELNHGVLPENARRLTTDLLLILERFV